MPFAYTSAPNAAGLSIADLITRGGDIAAQRAERIADAQARAAMASGDVWGRAFTNVGNTIAGTVAQMTDPRRQLEQMQVADAKRSMAGQQAVARLMTPTQPNGPMAPGETRQPQQSYLTDKGLWDVPALTSALSAGGFADKAPELLKGAEAINDSILKHQDYEQKAAQQHTILLGDLADATLKLSKTGVPIDQAMDFVVQPALATKRLDPKEYAQVKQQIAGLPPEQQTAALTTFMDAAAKLDKGEEHAKDAIHTDRYGRTTATNIVQEPGKPAAMDQTQMARYQPQIDAILPANDQTLGALRTATLARIQNARSTTEADKAIEDAQTQVAATRKDANEPITIKTIENGKLVEKVMTRGEALKAGVFTSQPPASVQVNTGVQSALGKMPGWALDASRPAGAEGNVLDPTLRMTPNGLFQDAKNFIASGQYPPTGRGADEASQLKRAAIDAKVGAIAADAGMDVPALRAFYRSNAKSLDAMQKTYDAAQANITTADRNSDLLETALKKMPDTGSPLLNQPWRTFQKTVVGNTAMAPIATYLASVQNEYGKLISSASGGATVLSDSARHEAQQLIDGNGTVAQMLESIRALHNEGNNRLLSTGEQIQRIAGRMNGGGSGTSGGAAKPDPLGIR